MIAGDESQEKTKKTKQDKDEMGGVDVGLLKKNRNVCSAVL